MNIKLVSLPLKTEDLLFYEEFIKKIGGKQKARIALLDIINRYFTLEYIDLEKTN